MTFKTFNTTYTLVDVGDGGFMLSGHPRFCPGPVRVTLKAPPRVGHTVTFTYAEPYVYPGSDEGQRITTTPVTFVEGDLT